MAYKETINSKPHAANDAARLSNITGLTENKTAIHLNYNPVDRILRRDVVLLSIVFRYKKESP